MSPQYKGKACLICIARKFRRNADQVASDYGSFVTVHAYHDLSVNRAIDAGVRLIQHNFLVFERPSSG